MEPLNPAPVENTVDEALRLSVTQHNAMIEELEPQVQLLRDCLASSISTVDVPVANEEFTAHLQSFIRYTKVEVGVKSALMRGYQRSREEILKSLAESSQRGPQSSPSNGSPHHSTAPMESLSASSFDTSSLNVSSPDASPQIPPRSASRAPSPQRKESDLIPSSSHAGCASVAPQKSYTLTSWTPINSQKNKDLVTRVTPSPDRSQLALRYEPNMDEGAIKNLL